MNAAFDLRLIATELNGEMAGDEILAPGPGHAPKNRSLSIKPDTPAPGRILVHSVADDDPLQFKDHVRDALGLPKWTPSSRKGNSWPEYVYKDAKGKLYLRVRKTPDKAFPQSHWDGAASQKGKPKGPKIPYRLPELLAASPATPVFICEGEKDAGNLGRLGFIATTNSEGAGFWTADLNPYFAGRTCFVLADSDTSGRAHAHKVARHLAPVAAEVCIVKLPDPPEKGDVSDWVEAGNIGAAAGWQGGAL